MIERLLSGEEMRLCDEYTVKTLGTPSRVLMERAAECAAKEIISFGFDISRTLVVCGPGNNGGDGFAAARFLSQKARENGIEASIKVLFASEEAFMTDECKLQRKLALQAGIEITNDLSSISEKTLIVDALFGIGLSRNVKGIFGSIIDAVNSSNSAVVSLDIPSGICSDTGAVMGTAIKADLTVTFAYLKRGLCLYPGASHCGRIVKADIGIGCDAVKDKLSVFTATQIPPFPLPPRSPDSNKGTYGKVLIIGGAKGMAGAAYLSAKGAYRMGAGLVKIFTTEENRGILQMLLPEAVLITYGESSTAKEISAQLVSALADASAAVIGPGLSQSDTARIQLKTGISASKCPLIIDADALNLLSGSDCSHLKTQLLGRSVITPHMGEMSRLTGLSIPNLKADPIERAHNFAAEHNIVCTMKDARTVVSDGLRTYLNTTGCSALSKGGSGDVLSGMIAALVSQGMELFTASCVGVYIHGKAGRLAADTLGEYSVLAGEITDFIGSAIKNSLSQTEKI